MSDKFDSLIKILNKLDSKEIVTVHSLMDELGISERSVHRYIRTLQDANFSISYDRSRETYAFDDGFCLRKPSLTVEETLAFALAKSVVGNFGIGMAKGLTMIEDKLAKRESGLPSHIILSSDSPANGHEFIGILHHAIENLQKVRIKYKALYSDELTDRTINPYFLLWQDGFWNLRGYCHLRDDFRTFALDRIVSLKVLDEHFLPKKLNFAENLSGSFGSIIDGEPVDVILKFDPEIRPYIQRKKWHRSQTEKELADGSLEVSFHVNGFEGIKQWIYRWIPYVEIIGPEELREEVLNELHTAVNKNQGGNKE